MNSMELPTAVENVIKILNAYGYDAYVVGGAVRDYLMGEEPHDYDITTSALPDDTKKIFPNHFSLGEKFGTVSVIIDSYDPIEVTTFRTDSCYKDGRHPDGVTFVSSIEEDLARRDFTINAIAYSPKTGFVDPFNGINDIEDGVIRAVNNPVDRFNEDGLRVLRAMRFASRFGFDIEPETKKAMDECINMIDKVSKERISTEFSKILMGDGAGKVIKNCPNQIIKIVPEWENVIGCSQNNKWHVYSVEDHILHVIDGVPKDEITRLAAFFHDIAKPMVKQIDSNGIDHFPGHAHLSAEIAEVRLKNLRYSSTTVESVCKIVAKHDSFWDASEKSVKKAINSMGLDCLNKLVDLRISDIAAQSPRYDTEIEVVRAFISKITENHEAVSLKDLAINGHDLINEFGLSPSKEIGNMLNTLLEDVLDNKIKNSREELLESARIILENEGPSLEC